ncbi:MAG: hypothetical protein IJ689_07095 [Alphaproteobacteria bacterium]|nr:hypothetical protein [Alphaproteobacteria bacterium]
MKNYMLMLGIAAVSIGSYAAYAGNSATMTVTATIAHDVSLIAVNDLDFGTITINPTDDDPGEAWVVDYDENGIPKYQTDLIISADDATLGTFTANIPNPSACNSIATSCGGLSLSENMVTLDGTDGCDFFIKYSGSGNVFNLVPDECYFESPVSGTFEQEVTITYHP